MGSAGPQRPRQAFHRFSSSVTRGFWDRIPPQPVRVWRQARKYTPNAASVAMALMPKGQTRLQGLPELDA